MTGPSRGLVRAERRGSAQGRTAPRPMFRRRERGFYCKPHDSRVFRLAGGLRGVAARRVGEGYHGSRCSKKVRAAVEMVHQSTRKPLFRWLSFSSAVERRSRESSWEPIC